MAAQSHPGNISDYGVPGTLTIFEVINSEVTSGENKLCRKLRIARHKDLDAAILRVFECNFSSLSEN
jgi:hypothetical protein